MKRIIFVGLALLLAILPLLPLSGCGQADAPDAVSDASETGSAEAEVTGGTDLSVCFFQAGAADAILLTTENSAVLVDCGEKGFGKEILSYLEEHGVTRLDYLIITHFDKDHVGGAAKVINNMEIGTVLQSNCPKDSDEYENYIAALENAGLEAETVSDVTRFTLDGVVYSVDPPGSSSYQEDESNNSSLIVTVQNGANTLLLAGDAETERISEFLNTHPGTCDVLKVPHHGRDEPMMENLLAEVQPAYAVITSSEDEPESSDTVAALENSGAQVFLTRTAPVMVESDGVTLTVSYSA